jgi:hypothetical protein
MAISRKPKPQGQVDTPVDVEALINRGGSIASDSPTATVNLRMPASLVGRIDEALKGHPIKKPRHTWLLEAVIEKLERESA